MSKGKFMIAGFDFSVAKPACCLVTADAVTGVSYDFICWPQDIKKTAAAKYAGCGVSCHSRNLEPVSHVAEGSSETVKAHIRRAMALADIINGWLSACKNDGDLLYVASEGLSFGSKGDAVTNLATYKGVFLAGLMRAKLADGLFTYSPTTMKSIAGCAGKNSRSLKDPMIERFAQNGPNTHLFTWAVRNRDLIAKTAWIDCVDDLCDAYWVTRTCYLKEKDLHGFPKIPEFEREIVI